MACTGKCVFDVSSDPLDYKTPDSELPSEKMRIPRPFTVTTDSYISLCSRVYAACCSAYNFEEIPESAFQYYAVTMLWKRFAEILANSDDSKFGFLDAISRLDTTSFYIPIPLRSYLKGIGHFSDPDGCDRQFVLPVLPISLKMAGIPWTFGKVSAETHYFYEAFPAPGIAALRMLADIKYTNNNCVENLLWNLPEELHPDMFGLQIESLKPTKNLLGWAPAQLLTKDQLRLLKSSKINDDFMANNLSSFDQSVRYLFERISDRLCYCQLGKSAYAIFGNTAVTSLPFTGSLMQGMAIAKHHEYSEFDRFEMYCEGNVSVRSPYKLNDELNKGAVISGYRMAKESIGRLHYWSCYDFDKYKCVPMSWINTRNTIYELGNVGRLNEAIYTTRNISKRILQNECIQHTMFEAKEKWNIYM